MICPNCGCEGAHYCTGKKNDVPERGGFFKSDKNAYPDMEEIIKNHKDNNNE